MEKSVLEQIASSSTGEFYTPVPEGYKAGKTKYVVVTGSVISGIGKGMFTASLAKALKERGVRISPIKLEAYLNVDAGTLNPYRHGEVFVLDDGTETDLDLGTYERFLDQDLSRDNFVTSGRIYQQIISREREGGYLGRDVQFIPHVTGEIKQILRELAVKTKADLLLIEIGGTVGDYENMFALEAMRQMAYEEGKENVCFINLTYILKPGNLGEHKSKAAQMGIKKLLELGIQPDIIVCRSEEQISEKIKEKISLNVNVPVERVTGLHDMKNIYTIPLFLHENKVDDAVLDVVGLKGKFAGNDAKALREWTRRNSVEKPSKETTIGIAGKYTGASDTYISILKALEHCEAENNVKINVKWIETTSIEDGKLNVGEAMKGVNGLIVPGGFGKRGTEGKIECIRFCREKKVPFLGLCFGFQMAAIEFARNVCGLGKANSTELEQNCKEPLICILPEQEKTNELGGSMRLGGYDVFIEHGTLAHRLYGKDVARERFRHRYNLNTNYTKALEKEGIIFSGKNKGGKIMQILELKEHPFFLATQFHPEFTSRPLKPNPLYNGFIKACI